MSACRSCEVTSTKAPRLHLPCRVDARILCRRSCCSWASPTAFAPSRQFVGLGGPPRAGGVARQILRTVRLPGLQNGSDEPPRRLQFVSAHEQRRVTPKRVENQTLVRLRQWAAVRPHVI